MKETINMTIPGNPIALKRSRHANIKKKDGSSFMMNYDPSKNDKKNFLLEAVHNNAPQKRIEGPIELHVTFYMDRPKNHYGTGKNADKLKPSAPVWHIARPDIDNFIKFIMDALNGTYWRDDSQICLISAKKIYTGMAPRTEISIVEL